MKTKSQQRMVVAAAVVVWFLLGLTPAGALPVLVPLDKDTATASCPQRPAPGLFPAWQAVDGVLASQPDGNGWAVYPAFQVTQTAVFETKADADFAGFAEIRLIQDPNTQPLDRFRLSYTTADRSKFADGDQNLGVPRIWKVLDAVSCVASEPGIKFSELEDKSIVATGPKERGTYTLVAPLKAKGVTGFRLEVIPVGAAAAANLDNAKVLVTEFQVFAAPLRGSAAPVHQLQGSIPPVPEPSTWIAGALLLVPLAWHGLRRRK